MSRFGPQVLPGYYGPEDPGGDIATAIANYRQGKRQDQQDADAATTLDIERERAGYRPGTPPADTPTPAQAIEASRPPTRYGNTVLPDDEGFMERPGGPIGTPNVPTHQPAAGIPTGTPGAPGALIRAAGQRFYQLPHGGYIDQQATPEARQESAYQAHTADERQYQEGVRGEAAAAAEARDQRTAAREAERDSRTAAREDARLRAQGQLERELARTRGEYGLREAGVRANATVESARTRVGGAGGTGAPGTGVDAKTLNDRFRQTEVQRKGVGAELGQTERAMRDSTFNNPTFQEDNPAEARRLQTRADSLGQVSDSLTSVRDLITAARGGDPEAIAQLQEQNAPDPTRGPVSPRGDMGGFKTALAQLEQIRQQALAKGHPEEVVMRAYNEDVAKLARKYGVSGRGQ